MIFSCHLGNHWGRFVWLWKWISAQHMVRAHAHCWIVLAPRDPHLQNLGYSVHDISIVWGKEQNIKSSQFTECWNFKASCSREVFQAWNICPIYVKNVYPHVSHNTYWKNGYTGVCIIKRFYAPAIRRMLERAYSFTPARPSVSVRVARWRHQFVLSFSGGSIRVLWTHFLFRIFH